MRRRIVVGIALAILALASAVRGAQFTLTLDNNNAADTWINKLAATTAYTTDAALQMYDDGTATGRRAGIIRPVYDSLFGTGKVPVDATIDSAFLDVYVSLSTSGRDLTLAELLTGFTYTENTSPTWDSPDGGSANWAGGGSFSSSDFDAKDTIAIGSANAWYRFDAAGLVAEWQPHTDSLRGAALVADDPDFNWFTLYIHSAEGDSIPVLSVYYTAAGPGAPARQVRRRHVLTDRTRGTK